MQMPKNIKYANMEMSGDLFNKNGGATSWQKPTAGCEHLLAIGEADGRHGASVSVTFR